MKPVLLVLLIFVSIGMIGAILLQRSEGGALGMGGGPGGLMSGRAAGDVLTRTTSILGAAFFMLCIVLAALSGSNRPGASLGERAEEFEEPAPDGPVIPDGPTIPDRPTIPQ